MEHSGTRRDSLETLRRLALGLFLIGVCSAILLVSDTTRRVGGARRSVRIAFVQYASHPLINAFMDGVEKGLREHGVTAQSGAVLRRFSAEGDAGTLNAIAKQVTDGSFDMVVSATTPCLQAVAKANGSGQTLHVFGMVTDPFAAGVGLDRQNRRRHPKHIVGAGTMEPVAHTFQLARALRPQLSVVGTVWNPGEVNSQVCLEAARAISKQLGLKLVEAPADTTSAVPEAAASLAARGVEAIWVGGDNVANNAMGAIVKAAQDAAIPVFSNTIGSLGSLFDLGPDYGVLGVEIGAMAAGVLAAGSTAPFAVEDLAPELLALDRTRLAGLRDAWRIPADVEARAEVVVDESGRRKKKAASAPASRKPARPWRLHLLHFTDAPFSEDCETGIKAGLQESGLVDGRDYTLKIRSAQGDAALLGPLYQAALTEGADLILTTSTPTLQMAAKTVKDVPVVFTAVADPVVAGAGKSSTDHFPNITGIATGSDFDRLIDIVQSVLPRAKRFGTLFVPSEVNSVFYKEKMEGELTKRGLELVATPVQTSSEVADAAAAMCTSGIDVVMQLASNLTATAFASIAQASRRAHVPLFSFITKDATMGSIVVVTRDHVQAGRDTWALAQRVLQGEDPAGIPFGVVSRSDVIVNLDAAREAGVTIPREIQKTAREVIGH